MKTIFASLLVLFAFNANSRVLVVKEYGVNATYSTIAAALSASLDNDTIVVYDKPSGQPWLENITIIKNLTFLHPNQGTRFKVPGEITIVPKAGMDLYFIGWDLNGKSITATSTGSTATITNRAKITVTDCINVANINLNIDCLESRVFYNQTNITGNISFRHGLVVANVISGGIYVDPEGTIAAQNDSILIIGNKSRWCRVSTQEAGLIANNYFANDNANTSWSTLPGQGNTLLLLYHNQSESATFSIVNNTIVNAGTSSSSHRMGIVFNGFGLMTNVKILNNLIIASAGATYGIWNYPTASTIGIPFISHNFINAGNITNFSGINELNYTTPFEGSIDAWGRAVSGSNQLINKGNYLGEYYDIDLTRNDIGTYGGPYTIDNYLTSGNGKGKVLYINIKHQLTNLNQILNVKGSAGAKF